MLRFFNYLIAFFVMWPMLMQAQTVYQPLRHPVYEYLDRVEARYGVSLLNFVRPLAREEIARVMDSLSRRNDLSVYDRAELGFYREEFAEEIGRLPGKIEENGQTERWNLLRHGFDTPARSFIAADLVGQGTFVRRESAANIIARSNGVRAYGYAGEHLGAFMRWYDNGRDGIVYDSLSRRVPEQGVVKGPGSGSSYEWEVAEGQFTYSNAWLRAGVQKMDLWRGSGRFGSIILSDKTPSFPAAAFQIKLADWIQFDYFHAWLISDFELWTPYQKFFETKYLASHSIVVRPIPELQVALGESIIYGGTDVNLLFLIPVISFRAADRWTRANTGNAQFFADVRYTPVRNVTAYATGFVDELDFSKVLSGEKVDMNYHLAYTLGALFTDLHHAVVPVASETVVEFSRVYPFTYTNPRPAQWFTSHRAFLGHWIGPNADVFHARHTVHPWRGWDVALTYAYARFGREEELLASGTVIQPAFLYDYSYSQRTMSVSIGWTPLHDLTGVVSAEHRTTRRSPEFDGAVPRPDGFSVGVRLGYGVY